MMLYHHLPYIITLLLHLLYSTQAQSTTCTISGSIGCSTITSLCPNTPDTIIVAVNTTYLNCQYPLNLTAESINVQGTFSGLSLIGSSVVLSNLVVGGNLTTVYEISVEIGANITVGNTLSVSAKDAAVPSNLTLSAASLSSKLIQLQTLGDISLTNASINTQSITLTGSTITIGNLTVSGNLTVLYESNFQVTGNINIGNSLMVNAQNTTSSQSPLATTLNLVFDTITLTVKNYIMLQSPQSITVTGSLFNTLNMTLSAASIFVANLNVTGNLTILHQEFIQFNNSITVSNFLIIDVINVNASQQNPNDTSVQFNSAYVNAKTMVFQTFGRVMVNDSEFSTFGVVCLYHSIHLQDFSINVWSGNYTNITTLLNSSISIGFITFGNLSIIDTLIQTPIFIVITQQSLNFTSSIVNTSAKACRTNMGAGRGLIVQTQTEFCSSGSASAGYGLNSMMNEKCGELLEYFMFLTHSLPYMKIGPTLSTGSGGYGYQNFRNSETGAGGGVVYIFAKNQIYLYDANITASGGNVGENDSLSAGSGGVIYMYSELMSGNQTNISAFGGSSYNNKGAGSGGMVKIAYQQIQKVHKGLLWINVNQGYQPSSPDYNSQANGIFYGPLCPAGRVRWFLGCQTCGKNTYNMISNEYCLACPVANDFEWNNSDYATGIQNPWGCFASYSQGPYYIWIVPGQIDLISITCYIGLLVAFVIFGVIIRRQIKKIKARYDDIECDFEALKKEMKEEKILTEKLKKEKSIKLYELMYHIHRITVAGSNTYLCPWVLPLIPPQSVKKYVLLQAFQNFARKFNKLSQWTKMEVFIIKLLYLIYPLHWYYYDLVKKRKYRGLCKLLEEFREYNLINNFQFEDKDLITLKFSKNKDYTSCYIDFFFYQKADLSYYNLSVPFIVYLSGEGNFIRPFYIQENDPFVKAMNFIVNRSTYNEKENSFMNSYLVLDDKEKLLRNLVNLNLRKKNQNQLKKFIINFNAISCTLDLSAPIKVFIDTLSMLIEFINTWNKKFFNKVKVQIDLILMISDLHEENIVSSSIHILSNKNQEFLQKVKNIIPRMNLNNEIDLKIGLFIYNPDQEINKTEMRDSFQAKTNKMLSDEYGQSEEDMDDNEISLHLLEDGEKNGNQSKSQSLNSKITRYLCLFRYFMLSHKIAVKDRYTVKLWQSFLILTQTALVFVWSIKIEIPYIFINLIAPFVGIIWIVSDSYGFGKLFLIFNAMNLLNELATLLFFSLAEIGNQTNLIKIVVCQSINLILVVLNMIVGSWSITYSKKLKNVD